jgi:hypothetical protein
MTMALALAIFAVTAGTGQMFVIPSGPGNTDLPCPAVMTLAAYLSMNVMAGSADRLPLGFLVAILVGIVAGAGNYGLIRMLQTRGDNHAGRSCRNGKTVRNAAGWHRPAQMRTAVMFCRRIRRS